MRLSLIDTNTGQFLPLDHHFEEHKSYKLRLEEQRGAAEPEEYSALMGEVGLDVVRCMVRGNNVCLEWEWVPDFYSGEFTLEICYRGKAIYPLDQQASKLTVCTSLHKLTTGEHQSMLKDLAEWAEGWQVLSPARIQGGRSNTHPKAMSARLDLLVARWHDLSLLVEMLLPAPRRVLRTEQRTVALSEVKTLTPEDWQRTLEGIARFRKTSGELSGGLRELDKRTGGYLPPVFPQTHSKVTLQVMENAFVVRFLLEVRGFVNSVLSTPKALAGSARDNLVQRRLRQAQNIYRRVNDWMATTWLSEVKPLEGAISPSISMLKHPVYSRLWRLYLDWHRSFTLLDSQERQVSIDRTYQLYEYWCFLKIIRALEETLGCTLASPESVVEPGADGLIRLHLVPGKLVTLQHRAMQVKLHFQRGFSSVAGKGIRTYSHLMRPDIVLELEREDGTTSLLVLDPKYRVGHDGLMDGLGAMHRYRDAIVDSQGKRVVSGGYILCPANPRDSSNAKYLEPSYHDKWRFGIIVMKPGADDGELRRVITEFWAGNLELSK